ncbi:glycosyltransferase family 1 protein [Nocardia sp. NPDC057353]|uniref:glycosyltransferase family 1 protein n=1 Tax=Nocardia sp. NPDC057353 TaxID=3346104 RepID=UPI003627588D
MTDTVLAPLRHSTIRVASVPASHVYVRHLADPDLDDGVLRLPDPPPADGRTVPGGWWPPLMLDPAWIEEHHREFDLMHIHFGFDTVEPAVLGEIAERLHAHGKPLVYTVHDLRNPHQPDPAGHRAQLDVLIPAADELITLTPGAAAEIERRWGRRARVLPHPHVVEPELLAAPRPAGDRFVLGVHVKSLRANMNPLPVLAELARVVTELPDAELRINLHDEMFDPADHWYNPEVGNAVLAFGRRRRVRVEVHEYFTDAQLWAYLSSLSASVLPYRFGTHSGWLEACYDLGTAVVAPDCGYYAQQRPCRTYGLGEHGLDAASLRRAVLDTAARPAPRATAAGRLAERRELAAAHRGLYERALR